MLLVFVFFCFCIVALLRVWRGGGCVIINYQHLATAVNEDNTTATLNNYQLCPIPSHKKKRSDGILALASCSSHIDFASFHKVRSVLLV